MPLKEAMRDVTIKFCRRYPSNCFLNLNINQIHVVISLQGHSNFNFTCFFGFIYHFFDLESFLAFTLDSCVNEHLDQLLSKNPY